MQHFPVVVFVICVSDVSTYKRTMVMKFVFCELSSIEWQVFLFFFCSPNHRNGVYRFATTQRNTTHYGNNCFFALKRREIATIKQHNKTFSQNENLSKLRPSEYFSRIVDLVFFLFVNC